MEDANTLECDARVRTLIRLMRRSRLQRGLISCDAGEQLSLFVARWQRASTGGGHSTEMESLQTSFSERGLVGKRVLWQLVESHPVRNVWRWCWATWDMARDGQWVLADAGWYGPEPCGFPGGVADKNLVPCRVVDLTADVWTHSD